MKKSSSAQNKIFFFSYLVMKLNEDTKQTFLSCCFNYFQRKAETMSLEKLELTEKLEKFSIEANCCNAS